MPYRVDDFGGTRDIEVGVQDEVHFADHAAVGVVEHDPVARLVALDDLGDLE